MPLPGIPAEDVANAKTAPATAKAVPAKAATSFAEGEARDPVCGNADWGVWEGVLKPQVAVNGDEAVIDD